MNHWPFVAGAYAIFLLAFTLDALLPAFRRRRLIAQLDSRWRREQTRKSRQESS